MDVRQIPQIDKTAFESIALDSQTPLVIKGLVETWPAVQAGLESDTAFFSYLSGFDSGHAFTAMKLDKTQKGRIFYNEDLTAFNFSYKRINFDTFRSELEQAVVSGDTWYAGSINLERWFPGFDKSNDLSIHRDELKSIWIGNQTRIAPHFDFPANLACNIHGERRVTLYPPEQLENLYIGPLDFTPAGQPISLVDSLAPDYEQFPRFKLAEKAAFTTTLQPGDAIVIPSMWWHQIEATAALNVLVNYWWRDSPAFHGSPLSALQHALLGFRDLPQHQRAVWRRLIEYYVFNEDDAPHSHIPANSQGILKPLTETTASALRKTLREHLK
jgi:hypothetical protein